MIRSPRASLSCIFAAAGVAGCFPSFDHMSGGAPDAATESSGTQPTTPDASNDGDGGAPPSTPEAGVEASVNAPPALFSCGFDAETRCKLGVEVCCGLLLGFECRMPGHTNDCDGIAHCGDKADCKGAGEQCCYDKQSNVGSCKTSCSSGDLIVCDKQKPTCPGSMSCFGNWYGLPYCF
jgi:hypothetical protein